VGVGENVKIDIPIDENACPRLEFIRYNFAPGGLQFVETLDDGVGGYNQEMLFSYFKTLLRQAFPGYEVGEFYQGWWQGQVKYDPVLDKYCLSCYRCL
jgi:hypothetical protein